MIKRFIFSLIASVLAVSVSFSQPTPRTGTPIQGVVRVKLQPQLVSALPKATDIMPQATGPLQVGIKPLDTSLRKIGGVKMRKVFPCAPEREAEHRKFGLDQWYEIVFDESISPLEARNVLKNTPGVQQAQVRVPMKLLEDASFRKAEVATRANAALPFNDPRLGQQWHYSNDGSMEGAVPGADVNLFKAWNIATGRREVIVAIIDGGVDTGHEDLHDHLWVNAAELNGKPGVDDDGDGYIDDIYGYNFCTDEGTIYPHTHGTHVAGTVGAINNNGIGVCGVAGGDGTPNSGVRLMSCQVFDSRSGAGEGDFAAAIIFAADHGATIAQCSWGWGEDGYYEQDVLDAVRYFTHSARSNSMTGGLCIFASGNDGTDGEFYPCSMEEVVAVSAMTHTLQPAPYSNYGSWVDITAPGGIMDFDQQQGVLSTLPDNTYGYSEGTSMATPHVSGIAALVLSKYGSNTLTNESLRQQLLSSVNDFYTANPQAEGLFGSGYIDAYKALQWGDGTAPAAVSDLVALAMQESIELSWTIPASTSGSVHTHILYYDTKPFDTNTLKDCRTVIIDTKFSSSGAECKYELSNLQPITTYYVALQAVDRWGNASPLSSILSVTTNRGPKMTLSRTSMAMNCTDGVNWSTRTFDIGNEDEGLLKWSIKTRTSSSQITPYAKSTELMTVPSRGKISVQPCAASRATTVVSDLDDFVQDEYPQSIAYHTGIYAYIGDNEYPNSMAQLFTVDAKTYPKGFNLTHICIDGNYGKHPIFEVYRGGSTISAANLLERYDAGEGAVSYNYDHALPEALFFKPGESFYLVVHFEDYEERNYPLGLSMSNGSSEAARAYMSIDKGKTWSKLSEMLVGSNYENVKDKSTWCIDAISKYPDWSEVLAITPSEGVLKNGEKQTVTVTHNGIHVPNGTYRAKLLFDTNESEKNDMAVTVSMNVSGQEPDVSFNKVVEFGNILVGQSKTVSVEVFNKGYGSFSGGETYASIFQSNISSTSPHFHGPEYLQGGIPARSTTTIELTYAPTEAGNHAGVIVLTDKVGRELRFNVTGAATEPARISVSPETIAVGDLDASGATKTVSFDIENKGKYPLQYVMPKFSTETFDGVSGSSTHRFGYVWQSNLYGATDVAYEGKPVLLDAVDISRQFGDYDYFSDPIDIGFDFPFYDKVYSRIYVSSYGLLSFAPYNEGVIYNMYPGCSYAEGLGVISVYGNEFQVAPSSRVEYSRQDGKFVVNFKDVLVTVYDKETIPASFHVALSPSGDIDIAFDDYNPDRVFQQGCNLWVGIVDPAQEDELTVTSSEQTTQAFWYDDKSEENNRWRHICTGTQFKFYAPKPNLIAEIHPSSAIISSGDKQRVTAVVRATDEMVAGSTYTDLVIQSNDLTSPTKLVRFNANIVGDLHPVVELTTDAVDFGSVFRTSVAQMSVGVQNRGRAPMTLQAVKVADGRFTTNFTKALEILPGQSKDIVVTLPTVAEGEVSDVLNITTTAGDKTVSLKGKVIGTPGITLGYTSVDETLASGDKKALPLTVTNTGSEPLRYSIVAGSHISYSPEYKEGSMTEYTYVSSLDDPSAAREWVDIETTGLGTQYNYTNFLKRDIVEVELPFEFTFYDKTYTKMYVYDAGFVSFDERKDEGGIWPEPPGDFPSGSVYTNVIAPYWGLHTMDVSATAGVFVYTDEEQAVVSYIEYGNSMNIGVDFQLVLRRDGTFTFNYKPAFSHAVIFGAFGVAGILEGGGKGVRLAERYIALGSSLTFSPVVHNTLMPGETTEADIVLTANDLAGQYRSKITVNTNVPTSPVIEVPVKLDITGSAKPTLPRNITVEQVAEYVNTDIMDEFIALGAYWYVPIEMSNTGSAPFTITSITVDSPKYDDNDMFTLYCYGTYTDSWTGAQVTGWNPYQGTSITVGRGVTRFAIPLWPNDYSQIAWQTPGDYKIRLTFRFNGLDLLKTHVVNVTVRVTEQPEMTLDKDEIRVKLDDDNARQTESLVIANTNGRYPLRYTVTVDPTGVGEKVGTERNTPQRAEAPVAELSGAGSTLQPFDVGKSDFYYDCPEENEYFEYNRALYWPALQSSTTAWNYGTTTTYGVYKAATAFTGPAGGFNISHIYFAMHPYKLAGKDVQIDIVNGDPQVSNDVIGHGTFHISQEETELYQNISAVVVLDRPVFISEGQQFYVVLTFPTGQEYPATLIKKQDATVSNRYLGYWDNYGWFDVAALFSSNYGSIGYMLSCLETTEGDAWIKVLDPATGISSGSVFGEVAAGERVDLKVRLSAAEAPRETGNKAMLIIHTNDPKAPVTNFPVYLDKNAAPVINIDASNYMASEGETTEFTATVMDPEGENFILSVEDDSQAVTVVSAEALKKGGTNSFVYVSRDRKTVEVQGVPDGVKVRLAITPGYGTAGQYMLVLRGTDKGGRTSAQTAQYTVVHVNRAPEALPVGDMAVLVGTVTDMIDLSALFRDPDDVVHTYTITLSDETVATIFRSGNEVLLRGLKKGSTLVTVTCTDPAGATGTLRFTLKVVDDLSAIASANGRAEGVSLSADGTQLLVSTADTDGSVQVDIFSLSGQKVMTATFQATMGEPYHSLGIARLPAATYMVSVVTPHRRFAQMVAKP